MAIHSSCACATLTSINAMDCNNGANVGGIRRLIVTCADGVTTGEPVDGVISSVTIPEGQKTYQLKPRKQSSSLSSELTIDDTTGVRFATTTVELVVAKMTTARLNAVRGLLDSEVVCFVEDSNGTWFCMGMENNVSVTAATMSTGTAATDANNVSITLSDISSTLPYTLSDEMVAYILDDARLVQ